MNYEPSAPSLEPDSEAEILPLVRKKCQQCKYETNTDTEFKWHLETHNGARNKEQRGITVTSKSSYPIGHAQWAANKNGNILKCKECDLEFNIESMLIAHIDRVHNSNFSHACTHCTRLFNTKEEVTNHISQDHYSSNNI